MPEKQLNPMVESFTNKIKEAIKGNNKGEDIKEAIMELMKANGVSIPNMGPKLGTESKKEITRLPKKEHNTRVESFTKKINEAIKGDNIAVDIRDAVTEQLKAYDIPISGKESLNQKKTEPYNEPKKTTWPVQKGYFHNSFNNK